MRSCSKIDHKVGRHGLSSEQLSLSCIPMEQYCSPKGIIFIPSLSTELEKSYYPMDGICNIPAVGNQVAFTSTRDGNPEIYLMSADGSNQIRLTDAPERDSFPRWSPGGTMIVFFSERGGSSDVYIMDRDGSNQKHLQTGGGLPFDHQWRP